MSTDRLRCFTAAALLGSLLLAAPAARAIDDGASGTSLTIVPAGPASGDAWNDEAPVKPKKKSTSRAATRAVGASAATAPASATAPTAVTAVTATAPAAETTASAALTNGASSTPPATAPSAAPIATPGTAVQPLEPIHLATPEPSALSTAPVWPRPDAERRAGVAAASRASSFGFGQPIDLAATLTRGAGTLGAMLLVGGLALWWARGRRGAAASADPGRDRLTVVSSRALAPRRSVHLVEVDGVRILVGLDAERIVPLALVPTPPRPVEAVAQTAPAKSASRAAAQPASVAAASAAPRPAPAPTTLAIDERNPVTVDVPELLARASRGSATRAPDPAALLSLTTSLKRHLRSRTNGNGDGGNGHGSIA